MRWGICENCGAVAYEPEMEQALNVNGETINVHYAEREPFNSKAPLCGEVVIMTKARRKIWTI